MKPATLTEALAFVGIGFALTWAAFVAVDLILMVLS